METNVKTIADKLNALVEKNSDAEKGFRKAAEISTAKSLGDWFAARAKNRGVFKEELAGEIHALGHPCVRTPSLTGDLHRAWMDLKAIFSADNDEAMLEEAIRGEKAALDEYKEVLSEGNLPASTDVLLRTHLAKIDQGLITLKTLADRASSKES